MVRPHVVRLRLLKVLLSAAGGFVALLAGGAVHAQVMGPAPAAPFLPAPAPPRAWEPPAPLPPPSVHDFGATTTAFGRVGYASGYRVGTSLALSYRTTTWPYHSTFGLDALEIALFTSVDRAEMGGRLSPFGFIFSFWSDSVFQGGYGRWNLIDIGVAYRPDGTSIVETGSSFSVGYSYELSHGVALRVAEIGPFAGVHIRSRGDAETKYLFDVGATLSTGVTFR